MSDDLFEGTPENVKQMLLRAKDQTRRTGVLVEAQVLQLRLWPRVVFKDVLDVIIDPLDIEGKTVNYVLRVKTPPKGKDLEKRIQVLEQSIHWLLGDDWGFVIKTRQKKGGPGKLLHRGSHAERREDYIAQPKADLPAYEFQDAMTTFKRYRIRNEKEASEAAAQPLPSMEKKS